MKLKQEDQVVIITGKDKGKKGKITRVLVKQKAIVVEKINLKTKHIKKTREKAGERIQFEAPIDSSNAMVMCPNCDKATRVGYKVLNDKKKERICKKCKESLDIKKKSK